MTETPAEWWLVPLSRWLNACGYLDGDSPYVGY